jgi:hypothetical protein
MTSTPTAGTHPLFRRFPLAGHADISCGRVPTPYHVYDGYGLFFGGTADLAAAREVLAAEQVQPLRTSAGRALMGVWACHFTQASLGVHHELQVSLFVTRTAADPVDEDPLALIAAMIRRPDLHMLCHGLWNTAPHVVAYNRELLALDAQGAAARMVRGADAVEFDFFDAVSGAALARGGTRRPARRSARCDCAVMRQVGLAGMWRVLRDPTVHLKIMNPVGAGLARNAVADSYTRSALTTVHEFEPGRDSLELSIPRYRGLDFRPDFVQFMDGFRFVYLAPGAV